VLQNLRDHHLVVVHDAAASRFPWETLQVDGAAPALNGGLSRRYLADNLPLAGWLEQRRQDGVVTLLLVIDPTEDLEGARKEAQRIREIAASMSKTLKLTELLGAEAARQRVRDELRSGKYDVLHYAGHAFFDAGNPGSSGLTCAKGEVLTGADITGIGNLPSLVFFNACEAARTRGMAKKSATARQTAGLAESLLRGGIANFMGTYWPVDDDAAAAFAATFYKALLEPQPLGAAILSARNAVRALSPQTARDWADYVLYGSYDFLLEELPQS